MCRTKQEHLSTASGTEQDNFEGNIHDDAEQIESNESTNTLRPAWPSWTDIQPENTGSSDLVRTVGNNQRKCPKPHEVLGRACWVLIVVLIFLWGVFIIGMMVWGVVKYLIDLGN